MSEIVDFIMENLQEIGIIILIVFFLLVLLKIKGINLNAPKPDSKLKQEVVVETFDSDEEVNKMMSNSSELFCESYLGNSEGLDKSCNDLSESNCADVNCCVFTNGKCVAGDVNGPTYKTDKNGKLISIDSYYYLGKYHG